MFQLQRLMFCRKRDGMRIVKIVFIQIGVTVLLMEAALWAFFPVSNKIEYKQMVSQNIPGLKKIITYDRNEFGFRSLSMKTKEKPVNTIRILCLGASTTDQTTQNTADTWSGLLEKKLKPIFAAKGINIEVAARGRSGELISDRLKWVKSSVMEFQPDIVVTLEGINDLAFAGPDAKPHEEKNLEATRTTLAERLAVFSQIVRRLKIIKNNLHIAKLLKEGKAVEWHSEHLAERIKDYQALPYVDHLERSYDPLPPFSEDLDEIVGFLSGRNIDVVVLAQPVLYNANMTDEELQVLWFPINSAEGKIRPSLQWLIAEVDKFNVAQAGTAQKYGAAFIDLNQKIPKNLKVFFDDCHYTDYGSEAVADAIIPVLTEKVDRRLIKQYAHE